MTREQFDQAQFLFCQIEVWQAEKQRLDNLKLCNSFEFIIIGNRGTNTHKAPLVRDENWFIDFINKEILHCERVIEDYESKIRSI